ncbi:synaptotagmin-like protein 3 [Betta splendens]|uniref:Synaptotagmin-like protein 3 n=1 Tax=Betta splendens TaxID=158456 RepID=A0A6P7LTD2_BETSP|nr:synaptotagmin-like protein 3 [Betta splendens]
MKVTSHIGAPSLLVTHTSEDTAAGPTLVPRKGDGFDEQRRRRQRPKGDRRRSSEGRRRRAADSMDLSLLQALEREKVLEVLRRDKQLRIIEEDRIRRIKCDLQELRRRGAKSSARQYGERTCARCQRPLGKLWNSGAVCLGCSHRICSKCRVGVGAAGWTCTVCHAYRDVKIRSGDWFLEERAKKFPVTGKYETAGETLLKNYNVLSHISVVPPTPPPHLDHFFSRPGDFKHSKPFTKSVENLMVTFASHMKKIASQNDVNDDLLRVNRDRRPHFIYSTQKSLSDTDISKCGILSKVPSLPNLFKKSKDSDHDGSSTGGEETSFSSDGGWRGSSSSISTECGLSDGAGVTGELELAVAYNGGASCLEITVGAGRNLSHGDAKKRKCHPYVKLHVLPDRGGKMKTSVKKHTTDPVYNEVFKYPIERQSLFGKRLQATVWHAAGTLKRKAFLGEVLFPLDGWRFDDRDSQGFNWYPLCPKAESPNGGAVE